MRLIFSKDRPAQLDLLLRSLERNAPKEPTTIIYSASQTKFLAGYSITAAEYRPWIYWAAQAAASFDELLRDALTEMGEARETVTFLCDDDVLYREIDETPAEWLATNPGLLTFSLRLRNYFALGDTTLSPIWDWTILPPHDHGYPGSIDGHVFRTADVRRMLRGQTIDNPLILETVLNQRCQMLAEQRPLMACYREQCLVGIDVNTVAEQKGRPHGKVYPQTAAELNERFLGGERISLRTFDHFVPTGCLTEVQFQWERP